MSFLKAEWKKLVIVNYAIDKTVLLPYIPNKTELDIWNNTCYVSVVGFMFLNTKILGIKIPFHVNFEEVNLRFYVKYYDNGTWKRGVVFIKEIVPKHALTLVANTVYNEHYETHDMKHEWNEKENILSVKYAWENSNLWQHISVEASKGQQPILEGSEAEFITEHYWGYTKVTEEETFEYEVTHPTWKQYKVSKYDINIDFGLNYGADFAFLNNEKPVSVMLAKGSVITVENKRKI